MVGKAGPRDWDLWYFAIFFMGHIGDKLEDLLVFISYSLGCCTLLLGSIFIYYRGYELGILIPLQIYLL